MNCADCGKLLTLDEDEVCARCERVRLQESQQEQGDVHGGI